MVTAKRSHILKQTHIFQNSFFQNNSWCLSSYQKYHSISHLKKLQKIDQLSRVKQLLCKERITTLYYSKLHSYLHYANLERASRINLKRLQVEQKTTN